MFGWYKNYCYSRPVALRIFYSLSDAGEVQEDRWSHLDKANKISKRHKYHMSGGEMVGVAVASAGMTAWAKNLGKANSNIINDTAQEASNILIAMVALWLLIGVADGLLRLPYFLVTQPITTLKVLNKWLVVRWGNVPAPLVVIWWILVPALILNAFGLLDWLGGYF